MLSAAVAHVEDHAHLVRMRADSHPRYAATGKALLGGLGRTLHAPEVHHDAIWILEDEGIHVVDGTVGQDRDPAVEPLHTDDLPGRAGNECHWRCGGRLGAQWHRSGWGVRPVGRRRDGVGLLRHHLLDSGIGARDAPGRPQFHDDLARARDDLVLRGLFEPDADADHAPRQLGIPDLAEGDAAHQPVVHGDWRVNALEGDVRKLDDQTLRVFAHEGRVDRLLGTSHGDPRHPILGMDIDGRDRLGFAYGRHRVRHDGGRQCQRSADPEHAHHAGDPHPPHPPCLSYRYRSTSLVVALLWKST